MLRSFCPSCRVAWTGDVSCWSCGGYGTPGDDFLRGDVSPSLTDQMRDADSVRRFYRKQVA